MPSSLSWRLEVVPQQGPAPAYKGRETRRQAFLPGLPSQAYGEAFDRLLEGIEGKTRLTCPIWDHWAKLAKASPSG